MLFIALFFKLRMALTSISCVDVPVRTYTLIYSSVAARPCKSKVRSVDLYSSSWWTSSLKSAHIWPDNKGSHSFTCHKHKPYLPLLRKHSPDGATPTAVADISNCNLLLIYRPRKDERLS